MAASAKKAEQQQLRKELTEKAVAFYAQHNVSKTVEKLLNEMFVASPKDVYGYMSEYLSDLAVAPIICGARCVKGIDERGGCAIDISIHCTVHGIDKFVASVSISINPNPPLPAPVPTTSPSKSGGKKKAPEPAKAQQEVKKEEAEDDTMDPFESFNTHIVPVLLSHSPHQQSDIDNKITCLRSKDGKELHSSSLLATSLAIAQSAALLSKLPLYKYLMNTLHHSSTQHTLPIPITSLLAGGNGKLRVREYCIAPLPGRVLSEQIFALSSVHSSVGPLLSAKTGGSTSGSGVYCPALDKVETGLELVRDAVIHSGLAMGEDISVLIDIGADRLFDQEKSKYELITGQWKSTDEVISMYSELLTSHPGLIGYIDPLHHKDVDGWKKLHETLGGRCLLVADKTLAAGLPISLKSETMNNEPSNENDRDEALENGERASGLDLISCGSLSLERTVTATLLKYSAIAGSSNYVMFTVPPTLTVNPLLVDLAVAMQCAFIRVGAPCGLTSTCLLSRMIHIREELSSKGTYEPAKALVFSCNTLNQLDQQ